DLAPSERKLEVLSLTKRWGLLPQSERFDKRIATDDVDTYKVVRTGWIVYNPYVIWEGAVHALRRAKPGIVSPVYAVWKRKADDGPQGIGEAGAAHGDHGRTQAGPEDEGVGRGHPR